ncbi:hypothetical protein [Lysinibacillus piscis]|uniref:Cdk activating kinase (CAK)/RNA polymerase II transcription initiation/nucleotide excision repair factor TFIIH/TFIIK, cyclin H subunit n=1 Tax=Lysinibacillus piscis TaxID=2518931 RepID=A0ABQ5NH17_9BACI|nr:hypothetical protein [Lysinibacillus sp. KH24]GLC87655.1 hypothetical protein LYSBPC_07820 [Lysinibacillus sp. KH24]
MEHRKQLRKYIQRAKRSLIMEKSIPILQYGLFFALLASASILLVSRLFIWPYYRQIAIAMFAVGLVLTVIMMWWKRVRDKEACHVLDSFFPHNELVTALSFAQEHPLVQSLLLKAVQRMDMAFTSFKARKKHVFRPKACIGLFITMMVLGILYIFPATAQMEAIDVEKEKAVITDIKKDVTKLEQKAETKEVKEQLQELQQKLQEAQTAEAALREVVKKQKELALKEQQLKDKQAVNKKDATAGEPLSKEEGEQLQQLAQLQQQLAQNANTTQTAMNKLGKPASSALQKAIANANQAQTSSSGQSNQSATSSNSQQQSNGQQGAQQGTKQQGTTQGQNDNGQQQGTGAGQGAQSNGQGMGSGSGQGSGTGKGQGTQPGGQGAGIGQGSRNLVTTPNRIGGSSETSVDGGKLGEGSPASAQQGNGPITKGSIRPYEEVIGAYKDSYLESSERLQLPKDLQHVVQSYFTSIESQ